MEKRYNSTGDLELLVQWQGKSALENSWLLYEEFKARFPSYQLEGKLDFVGEVLIGSRSHIIEEERQRKSWRKKNEAKRCLNKESRRTF